MRKFSCALFAACLGTAAAQGETVPGRWVAAATIAPLASLTAMVAGPAWEVRTIVPPGVSPHVFEPTPRDAKAVAPARLVVTVGAGYDSWAVKVVKACASGALIHDAEASVGIVAGGEEHEGEIGRDPHFWLSPRWAARALGPLAESFAKLDPSDRDGYRSRAGRAEGALRELDEEIAALLAPVRGKSVVSAHNAWTYFLSEFGLVNAGSVEPVPGREPSPRELKELLDLARSRGLAAIFAEPQFPLSAINVIAHDAGLRVVIVDPEGGVAGRLGYFATMRFNARAFRDGLGTP